MTEDRTGHAQAHPRDRPDRSALTWRRAAESCREVLYASLDEYDRLPRLINDMLYLARADCGLLRPAQERVDLAAEIDALFEFFDAWAEEQGITLVRDGQAATVGDAAMLHEPAPT